MTRILAVYVNGIKVYEKQTEKSPDMKLIKMFVWDGEKLATSVEVHVPIKKPEAK